MSEENIKAVEKYLDALRRRDLSFAPLADDLVFSNPMVGKGQGAENLKAFLSGFLPAIKEIKLIGHVCEKNTVATRWELDSVFGIVSIADFFVVRDGIIIEAYGYFDPRPFFG